MLDLDLDRLKGRKLFLGTPMYDGKCHSEFTFSVVRLASLCARLDIELYVYFSCHDALITRSRDITVDVFLKSDADNFIFIDADIGFDAGDVIRLLAMQIDDAGQAFDVLAAPYPVKHIAWDQVMLAAKRGLADQDSGLLARYASAILINPAHDTTIPLHQPVEVSHAGTGFMMIKRETFERFRKFHPTRTYYVNYNKLLGEESRTIHAFFDTELDDKYSNISDEIKEFARLNPASTAAELVDFIDSDATMKPYSGKFFSEDYAFCRRVREAGMKVWLCPWMELIHVGSHRYTSRLADLGNLGGV